MAGFDDGKDEGALRTIGEVSDALGIKPHVLRYWEQQFTILKPLKRSGGRRYYRPEDVKLVETIDRLVNVEGYTLKGAQAAIRTTDLPFEDRRSGDRRSAQGGDRRKKDRREGVEGSTKRLSIEETVEQLKAVRARLAKAIEA